jgi:hypothetical protein
VIEVIWVGHGNRLIRVVLGHVILSGGGGGGGGGGGTVVEVSGSFGKIRF